MDSEEMPTPESDDHITLTTRAEAFAELADLDADEPDGSPRAGAAGGDTAQDGPVGDDPVAFGGEAAPPVVAVVVVHNAGDWLDELLVSLDRQTYDNLSVLVIDAASDIDPTPRVARILPGAFVRRLEANVGYGPTVNEILDLVSGASFYCLCHDDVALDDDCIHELVAESFRSNAGITGPKLVDWHDPERLSSVGFTVDRSGGRAPYAEHGELDQGQHDAVRDVFAVTGGCTLVRSDLFAHLGGFDPEIDLLGEDLDLCWRAHLVGARVVVAPRARARHLGVLGNRVDAARLPRVDAAHRLRTVLSNHRLGRLLLLLPLIALISLVEATVEFSMGRRSHARAVLLAWGTNFRSLGSIHRARRRVRTIRERGDRSVARLQTKSWARLDGLIQAHRRERAEQLGLAPSGTGARESIELDGHPDIDADDADADGFVRTGAPRRAYSLVSWGIIAVVVVLVVGTRELFFGPLPAIGSFARPPGSLATLWHTVLGSWNPQGLGSHTTPAAGLSPVAIVGTVFGGALGFVRRVAILVPVPLGLFGAWRLARPIGSRRAQFVSLVVYAAVPVPWNALAQGRWGGLLVYGVAPWILQITARSMRLAPFASEGSADRGDVDREPAWWAPVLGFGLLLAVVGALVPAVAAVAVVVAVGLVVGSLLLGRLDGLGRLALTTLGAVVVAAVLLLPWTLVGPARSGWTLAGVGGGVHGWLGLGHVLRFQSGPMGAGVLGYAFLVAAALPLVIGRAWRFAWGVRAWTVAGACFTVVWLGQQSWFGLPTPAPEVFLAPAAVALAFGAAFGAAAFEADLSSFHFGWPQGATAVATLALVLSVLPVVGNATDGRWKMAPIGLDQVLDSVASQRAHESFRVLWVGDPSVLPVAGWNLDATTSYGITDDGMATMAELWSPADAGGSATVARALDLATSSNTTRLGRILADASVRYIVLPRQIVPLPYRSTSHPIPDRLLGALDDQLDLARVPLGNDAVVVYRNDAWHPGQRLYPSGTPVGETLADTLDAPSGRRVGPSADPGHRTRLRIPAAGILATGQPADPSWRLSVDGRAARPVTLFGWEQGFVVTRGGAATLHRRADPTRPVVLVVVGVLWIAAILGWLLGRRRRIEGDLVVDPSTATAGSGSLVRLGFEREPADAVQVAEVRVGDRGGPGRADSPTGEEASVDDADRGTGDEPGASGNGDPAPGASADGGGEA